MKQKYGWKWFLSVLDCNTTPRGGDYTKYLVGGGGSACDEKIDPKDLRFCKNEGSKRSNNNKKGGQQD